jgi:hypothetical protein
MIYEKFDRATGNMTACALLLDGKPVGRVVIKFGAAATAFVHIWGAEMVSARATGYGYDKASAAVLSALSRLAVVSPPADEHNARAWNMAIEASKARDGAGWATALEDAGFTLANVM